MLNKNISTLRKSKDLSQQELADQLNVVRQTVSKWERGLSVPDSEMLITISKVLDTSVNILLGETITEKPIDEVKIISKKLEQINELLAYEKAKKRKWVHWGLISLLIITTIAAVTMITLNSPYLAWNYNDPELAVVGTIWHGIEWIFVRLSPAIFILLIVGIIFTSDDFKQFMR